MIHSVKHVLSWVLARKAKQFHAGLWLGVFLLLQALVVFPAVHHLVHSDSSNPDHECAVTLLAHGHVDSSDPSVHVLQSAPMVVFIQASIEAGFISTDVQLLPSRGPPAPLSLHS